MLASTPNSRASLAVLAVSLLAHRAVAQLGADSGLPGYGRISCTNDDGTPSTSRLPCSKALVCLFSRRVFLGERQTARTAAVSLASSRLERESAFIHESWSRADNPYDLKALCTKEAGTNAYYCGISGGICATNRRNSCDAGGKQACRLFGSQVTGRCVGAPGETPITEGACLGNVFPAPNGVCGDLQARCYSQYVCFNSTLHSHQQSQLRPRLALSGLTPWSSRQATATSTLRRAIRTICTAA